MAILPHLAKKLQTIPRFLANLDLKIKQISGYYLLFLLNRASYPKEFDALLKMKLQKLRI